MGSLGLMIGDRVSFHDWNDILEVTVEDIEHDNRFVVKSTSGDFFIAETVKEHHGPKFQNAVLKNLVSPNLRYKGRKSLDNYLKAGTFLEEGRR